MNDAGHLEVGLGLDKGNSTFLFYSTNIRFQLMNLYLPDVA